MMSHFGFFVYNIPGGVLSEHTHGQASHSSPAAAPDVCFYLCLLLRQQRSVACWAQWRRSGTDVVEDKWPHFAH